MSDQQTPMNSVINEEESSILIDPYAKDVQLSIWRQDCVKTRNALFGIGLLIFVGDIIAIAAADAVTINNIAFISIIPIVFIGLGLFARLQPLLASLAGCFIIAALTAYTIYSYGAVGLISGWWIKIITLYFIITSIRSARSAEVAKKQLALMV